MKQNRGTKERIDHYDKEVVGYGQRDFHQSWNAAKGVLNSLELVN